MPKIENIYFVACDSCRERWGITYSVQRSAQGGYCNACRRELSMGGRLSDPDLLPLPFLRLYRTDDEADIWEFEIYLSDGAIERRSGMDRLTAHRAFGTARARIAADMGIAYRSLPPLDNSQSA